MSPRRIGILVALRHGKYRETLAGVVQAARERGWQVAVDEPEPEAVDRLRRRGCTGLVAQVHRPRLAQALRDGGLPAVNVTNRDGDRGLPQVAVDDRAVGRRAARYLRDRGCRRFLVVTSDTRFGRLRREGFLAALSGGEVRCVDLDDPHRERLIVEAEPGTGVFVQNDQGIHQIRHRRRSRGLPRPKSLVVIGAGRDRLECRLGAPPFASVSLAGSTVGRRAVAVLATLLDGGTAPPAPIVIPPGPVLPGDARPRRLPDDPLVAAFLRYVTDHLDCSVGQCLRILGGNRRWLEYRCRAVLGRSPHRLIADLRIERAQQLLVQTDLRLEELAPACGIATAEHLCHVFRRATGVAPARWRRAVMASIL